jgi:uncharacterized coiled-coil DUF342 family protein
LRLSFLLRDDGRQREGAARGRQPFILSARTVKLKLIEARQTIANLQAALSRAHEQIRERDAAIARLNEAHANTVADLRLIERQLFAERTEHAKRAEQSRRDRAKNAQNRAGDALSEW